MEPLHAVKDAVPIEIGGIGHSDRGVSAVVNDLRGALAGTLFAVVDAHALAAADDLRGVHAELAQGIDGHLTDLVRGELGNEGGVHAVVGKGNGHVGLGATEGGLKLFGLHKAQIPLGGKAKHQLAKGNDLFHIFPPKPVKTGNSKLL